MAYLIILEEGKKRKVDIHEEVIFVGRDPEAHVVLGDPSVSGRHCQILETKSGYRLVDLGSKTGTFVNNEKVEQVDLKETDVIRVGKVKMALKAIGEEAPPPAVVPGRGGSRRRKGKAKEEPLKIKKEFAQASERGGERLVRRKLRKGSSMPVWLRAVLAFWAVVAVLVVVMLIVKQARPSPYHDKFVEAKRLEGMGQYEQAINLYGQIPIDDTHYGDKANEDRERLIRELEARQDQSKIRAAKNWYENNIMLFLQKYIDAPPDKPVQARKIKLDYRDSRSSYVRVLVLCRIDYYIENYPNEQHLDAVKKLRRKYAKEIDEMKPPTFRDAEVEGETWLNLSGYGNAWQAITQWEKSNTPSTAQKERIAELKKRIRGTLASEWAKFAGDAERRESEGNFRGANAIFHRFLKNCKGYDAPEAKELQDFWQQHFDANEARLRGE
jgi:hypothetical protein